MENYISNVIPSLQQWWSALIVLAYLIGIAFAALSLAQSISHKHRINRSVAVWTLWAAVLLLNIPAFMDSLSMTMFNQTSEQTLSYTPPPSPGAVYIQFAAFAIGIVGIIGIIRGLCLLRDTPNQAANFSRSIVHIFGGSLAVNLVTFLSGIGASLGGDVQTTITNILG